MKQSFINSDKDIVYKPHINDLINKAKSFIFLCEYKRNQFRLTPNSEPSPYALLFAILTLSLLGEDEYLEKNKDIFDKKIRNNLYSVYNFYLEKNREFEYDKPFLQLLSFSLSSLEVINTLKDNPLSNIVKNVFSRMSVEKYLDRSFFNLSIRLM